MTRWTNVRQLCDVPNNTEGANSEACQGIIERIINLCTGGSQNNDTSSTNHESTDDMLKAIMHANPEELILRECVGTKVEWKTLQSI